MTRGATLLVSHRSHAIVSLHRFRVFLAPGIVSRPCAGQNHGASNADVTSRCPRHRATRPVSDEAARSLTPRRSGKSRYAVKGEGTWSSGEKTELDRERMYLIQETKGECHFWCVSKYPTLKPLAKAKAGSHHQCISLGTPMSKQTQLDLPTHGQPTTRNTHCGITWHPLISFLL